MNVQEKLQIVRLSAEAKANREDASLWRWFSDLAEDGRIVMTSKSGVWTITVDGQLSASQLSFDAAVRVARKSHVESAHPKAVTLAKSQSRRRETA